MGVCLPGQLCQSCCLTHTASAIGVLWVDFNGRVRGFLGYSLSFQSRKKKEHLTSREASCFVSSQPSGLTGDVQDGCSVCGMSFTYLCHVGRAVQREASDWEGSTADHWLAETAEGRATRVIRSR